MTNIVIRLCDDWALGYDNQQWIVYKRRQRQGKTAWRPRSFIASKKLVLLRVITELGVSPLLMPNALWTIYQTPSGPG